MLNTLTELYAHWDDVLSLIGALFVALQAVVLVLTSLAKLLGQLAVLTQSRADDVALERVALVLAQVHDALVRWQRWLPRARLGKVREPLVGATIPPPPEPLLPPPDASMGP
jgi:hypothetical protein